MSGQRVSQAGREIAVRVASGARLSRVGREVMAQPIETPIHLSRFGLETLASGTNVPVRVSRLGRETLLSLSQPSPTAHVSALGLEALTSSPADARLTRAGVEVLIAI
jgi:hypothetical protein